MTTPTDPLFGTQWQFDLIGDIARIWDDYTGQGVSVVVYDNGVEYTHADLAANYDATMHFTFEGVTYDPFPVLGSSGHGTSTLGLIGAEADNDTGGVGVAFGATLTGVDYFNDLPEVTSPIYAAGMLWAANFDIMSNSWNYDSFFNAYSNMNISGSNAAIDLALYAQICATGRGGLGTVIVQSAGNDATNANGNGHNASRFTLTIAATEQDGTAADYSNYGYSVLVAAPAAAVTTDLTGSAGFTPGDYTTAFDGTSASAPVVSGVVALMLQAAPGLGWRDVANILALSASHTGSALGGPGTGFEHGGWQVMGGNGWNGGGAMFHQSYGHGMVDAFAAVRMAEAWGVMQGGAAATSANEASARVDYVGSTLNIPNVEGQSLRLDLTSTATVEIESLAVTVRINHSFASDLTIVLIAPDGSRLPVFENNGGTYAFDTSTTWTFGVEALRGMSAAGQWSIEITDVFPGFASGFISSASIEFFGSAASVDDVHSFTADYAALAALDPGRLVIADDNGGVDWLNFAAIADDLTVKMTAGGEIRFGTVVAAFGGTEDQFENLFAGDGGDAIRGNGLANHVQGARGNDALHGLGGNDNLLGGEGRDRIFGEAGRDVLRGGAGNDTLTGGGGKDRLSGEAGQDRFVFAGNFGADRVLGFVGGVDVLALDDAIWGGAMTAAEVVATFATDIGEDVLFDFGDGRMVTLAGLGSLAGLAGDLVIF